MLAISWQTSANITSYNGYELNGDVVSNGNLEWLQWSTTDGLSMRQALNNYEQDGWSLASNSQVNALFGAFGFNQGSFENTDVMTRGGYTSQDETVYDDFIELFGRTTFTEGGSYGHGNYARSETEALFGMDIDNDGLHQVVQIGSDKLKHGWKEESDWASLGHDRKSRTQTSITRGVALVRSIEVSEPSAFVIIALGIMSLAARRFKKQS